MTESVKNKLINGAVWSLIERFGYLTIQFVTNLVLARLLSPNDFGTVGILLVFTNLSLVLVDSGLGAALIQKKKINQTDTSTVFYTNLGLAVFVYFLLLVFSPYISQFFKNPDLTLLLRVISVIVVIDAFSSIQSTLLGKRVNFKKIAKIKIIAAFVSTATAIGAALFGVGVWSLVIQYITYSVLRSFLLWSKSDWHPTLEYSYRSFKSLFGYGSKLLLSTFISELYNHFQSIVIGRKFLATDLGYYTQARQLQQIPVGAISNTINQVSFPVYASLQDDKLRLANLVKKNLKLAIYINFPLMFFLAFEAQDIIVLLYSQKWLPSVPYFQFLCLGFGLLLIVHQTNLTVLKAIGKSDIILKLEIIKKVLGITFILIATNIWGIWGIMYALTLNSVVEVFFNGYYLKKNLSYGAWQQIKDFFPTLLLSFVITVILYVLKEFVVDVNSYILGFCFNSILFFTLYVSFSKLLRFEAASILLSLLKEKMHFRK